MESLSGQDGGGVIVRGSAKEGYFPPHGVKEQALKKKNNKNLV